MSVTLHTDVGDMKIELFCEHCPKACENFLALCASDYYNGCLFHRNIKGFIVQTGDPTGTGKNGKSIWGKKFEDELKDELKHNTRGIISMASNGPNTNNSQFFITYTKQPQLDMKYTLFGNSERKDNIVDERNKKGWTPLMYAACCANLKVALLLLEEGAEPDIKNFEGQTALILASKCGSGDVVNLLIDNDACVNERDVRGWTALFYAIAFGHRSVVQLLIERGAFADIDDDNERITPLMLAAEIGHERIVRDLLQLGINVNVESKSGDTARSLALKYGHMNVKYLIDSYLQSKRKTLGTNLRSIDLPSLLKELQLTKYYHLFENHGIDLNTFWLLTDDDLKEIGIQLLGPRKKICMAISQYQQEQSQKNAPKEAANLDSILMENKKLHLYTEKLKTMVLQEKHSKTTAERNLAEGIRNIKNYDEMFKSTLVQVIDFLQKLKENHDYLRSLLCSTFQDMNFNSNRHLKFKIDSIFQSLDCMQKLVEIQQQNISSLQQSSYHK